MAEMPPTVGVLYPGEMGASLAAMLRARGARVVTTLGGRSAATARRGRDAGFVFLDSLADVVRRSDVLISLVPPAAAEDMAAAYCGLAHLSPPAALYVDANSIRPELASALAGRVARCGRGFVDAAINGLARNLATSGTLFLSGVRAADVAQLFDGAVRVRILGAEPGRASAMKMLLSGLSKGTCGLFVELALLAQRQGMLAEMLQACSEIYPGVTAVVERMLPTYPQHAGRRATEMRELEQTAHSAGLEPRLIAAVRQVHEMLAAVPFEPAADREWTVASLIQRIAQVEQNEPLAVGETSAL